MSTTQVLRARRLSDINIANIEYANTKINKKVPITYDDGPLYLQTPFLEVYNPIRPTEYPNILQFDTLFSGDSKRRNQKYFNFIRNLELHAETQIELNGAVWFADNTSTDNNIVLKSLIRCIDINSNKNKDFDTSPDQCYIKWVTDGDPESFVDEDKTLFNPAEIRQKDLVKLIIEVSGLWIERNQCGLAVIVKKVLVRRHIEKIKYEYIFNESVSDSNCEENEENNIISLLATEQEPKKKKQLKSQKQQQPQTQPQPQPQPQPQQPQQPHFDSTLKQNKQKHTQPNVPPVISTQSRPLIVKNPRASTFISTPKQEKSRVLCSSSDDNDFIEENVYKTKTNSTQYRPIYKPQHQPQSQQQPQYQHQPQHQHQQQHQKYPQKQLQNAASHDSDNNFSDELEFS